MIADAENGVVLPNQRATGVAYEDPYILEGVIQRSVLYDCVIIGGTISHNVETAPQFDSSETVANTEWVQQHGMTPSVFVVAAEDGNVPLSHAGGIELVANNAVRTLPLLSSVPNGTSFSFYNIGDNPSTLAGMGGDLITPNRGAEPSSTLNVASSDTITVSKIDDENLGVIWLGTAGSVSLAYSSAIRALIGGGLAWSNLEQLSDDATLQAAQAGELLYTQQSNGTITLPLASEVMIGKAFSIFNGNGAAANTIVAQGSDVIHRPQGQVIADVSIGSGDLAIIVAVGTSEWMYLPLGSGIQNSAFWNTPVFQNFPKMTVGFPGSPGVVVIDGDGQTSAATVLPQDVGGTGTGTSAADGALIYQNGAAYGGAGAYWDDMNTRLGINTVPTTTLDVGGTITGTAVKVTGTSDAPDLTTYNAYIFSDAANNKSGIQFVDPPRSTNNKMAGMQWQSGLFELGFYGDNGADFTSFFRAAGGNGTGVTSASFITPLTAQNLRVTSATIPSFGMYLVSASQVGLSARTLPAFVAGNPVSAVNYLTSTGSTTGNAVAIAPAGTDTDISLTLSGKGAGGVNVSALMVTNNGHVDKVRVVTAAGDVTVTSADYIIVVNKTVGAATAVNLPASPTTGQVFYAKDGKGDALVNNITITPNAGTIDGASTLVMNLNYQSAQLVYNGTEWNIL